MASLLLSSAVLAGIVACSGADPSSLNSASGPSGSTGGSGSSGGASSPANASSDGGAPRGTATDASPGGPKFDAAPVFDPATCECFPGKTRWCDPADGTNWGKQTCNGGGTWDGCAVVADAPAGCDGQPFNDLCCLGGTACCEDKGDLGTAGGKGGPPNPADPDAGGFSGSTSVGSCDQIACPAAIDTSGGLGRK
jgi:hypothetical protein